MARLVLNAFPMRLAVLGFLGCLIVACSSPARTRKVPIGDNPSLGRVEQATSVDRGGDVTVASTTGDDLSWLAPIYFEFDSSDLSAKARDTLARLHEWMAAHPKAALTIEGHCDEQGTTEYNIALGQRRAQNIANYLGRLGTDSKRVRAVSFGAERPAVDGHDEVAWSKNRRGELYVAP